MARRMRALERSLPLKLLQAREAVMEMFRPHLHAHGVTEQQWRVLRALSEASDLDAGMLARRVCLLMPSLSRILRDLAKAGLLNRRNNPDDRRIAIVTLTDEGRALFDRMSRESESIYAAIEQTIGAEAYGSLVNDLDRLIANLNMASSSRCSETDRKFKSADEGPATARRMRMSRM